MLNVTLALPATVRRTLSATVLGLALAGGSVAGVPAPAFATIAETPSADQAMMLDAAETYFARLKTMKARFLQVTSMGDYTEGTLTIARPGRMRLEYDAPSPILVLADGSSLIYLDKELDQVSYLDLDSTPAGILLRENVSFSDPDLLVTGVRHAGGVAEIDVVTAADPAAGALTLVFTDAPFELRQWRIVDAQGTQTTVSLDSVQTGVSVDGVKFTYVKPVSIGGREK